MKEWLEYAAVWLTLKTLGTLPRRVARSAAASITSVLFSLQPKLKKTAEFNLRLAFPDWTEAQRKDVTSRMTRHLGWMAAEFARLPRLAKENIEELVILEGHENFLKRFLTLLGRKLVDFGKDFHARQVKLRRHLKRYEQQFPFQQTHWHGIPDGL